MIALLLVSFAAGVMLAIPVWIVSQRSRPGVRLARRFDPRDVVPCELDPVVLDGRLLPRAGPAAKTDAAADADTDTGDPR